MFHGLQSRQFLATHLHLPGVGEPFGGLLEMPNGLGGIVQIAGVKDAEHQFHLLGVFVGGAVVRQELLVSPGRFDGAMIAHQLVGDVQQLLSRQQLSGVQPHQLQVEIGRRGAGCAARSDSPMSRRICSAFSWL